MTENNQSLALAYQNAFEVIEEYCGEGTETTEALLRLQEAFFWAYMAVKEDDERGVLRLLQGGKGVDSPREESDQSGPETGGAPPGA